MIKSEFLDLFNKINGLSSNDDDVGVEEVEYNSEICLKCKNDSIILLTKVFNACIYETFSIFLH